MVFYAKYQQVAAKHVEEQQLQARAVETTLKALFLPELQCSKGEAEAEDNCVDMLKVRAITNEGNSLSSSSYFDILSFAKVTLYQIYPGKCFTGPGGSSTSTPCQWVIYDQARDPTKKTNMETTFFVVTLRDETAGIEKPAYGYGYLEVEVFS